MIRRLKWKFVAVMMTIVAFLLVIIFSILFYSTRSGYVRSSMDAMHGILANDEGFLRDPKFPRDRDPFLLVDVKENGEFSLVKNGPGLSDSDIRAMVLSARQSSRPFGELKDQYLRFMHRPSPAGGERYVFMDTYFEYQALHRQMIYSALISLGAFAVFFLISIRLAGWVAGPVEEAWDKQRQFVADASHELKTPLTVILANAKIIADSREITGQKNIARLENIGAEAGRMKFLIESMLTLARSDAGLAPPALVPINFSFLAEQSVATFEPIYFEAGKDISCRIQENIRVNGDEKKLRQLVGILLDNACKYSRPQATVLVTLTASGGRDALFTVTSPGTPLSGDDLKRIFDRFYRLSPSRGEVPGYGLGLSIAESIASEHKGKLWAQSDGTQSNSFSFRLPLLSEG